MAEIVVGPVIDKLVKLLVEEAKLFKGVQRDVESLKGELESIKCFLKDAEARSEKEDTKDGVKVWVTQVRDEANRIEDVIDEYLRHVTPRCYRTRFLNFLQKIGCSVKRLKARRGIASEVQDIKVSLREIKERSERYDFRLSSEELVQQYDPRLGSIFIEEDDIVGIDSTRDDLISMLVNGKSMQRVISLVGAGGIGKTTLASKVYDSQLVKNHFNCRAWITVSQSYNKVKLLENMTRQICIDAECTKGKTDDIEGQIKSLREYLKTQRYVVVFDDVWDVDFWEFIKSALPKNDKGSRVIVTTRNDRIAATACQETPFDLVHKLQPFSEEIAWDLFCKKAFRSKSMNAYPKELEELSHKIVSKCQGLPLLITAMASLLSTKEKTVLEWQQVLDNMSSDFESYHQLTSVYKILSLSYNDLPYHLKSCFLYFGIFPEDYSVNKARLYRMWIAEGFVRPKRDKNLEDVAKQYLDELINRNLVQASFEKCTRNVTCKVHDMMREIILLKADELGFCQFLDEKNSRFRRNYRRLSINGGVENVRDIVEDSGVRSIFIFNASELTDSFVATLFKKFKLLRVLDFSYAPLYILPKEVGNLFHLKYLNLRSTKIDMLPNSLRKLQNLQALDVGETLVRELPCKCNDLPCMRHFLSFGVDLEIRYGRVKIPRGIGCWEDLQTLNRMEAHEGLGAIMNEFEKLRRLRSLGITRLTTEMGKSLCAFIEKMNHLDRLQLVSVSEDEILDLESISSPPSLLRFLFLRGPLPKLPHWILKLNNLLEFELANSKLLDDPTKVLHNLPNLQRLFLLLAYEGEELHFEEGGFQKLKLLSLSCVVGLKAIKIDRGALPCLEMLEVDGRALKEVPSDIQHLTNLRTLRFYNMPEEFVRGLEPDGGRDYWIVEHVPSVTFWRSNGTETGQFLKKLRESDPLNICCARHLRLI